MFVLVVTSSVFGAGATASCSSSSTPTAEPAADAAPGEAATDDATSDAAAPSCRLPGTFGNAGCQACVAASCCEAVTACAANTDCAPLQTCILECLVDDDGGGCKRDCEAAHPAGSALWQPVYHCWYATPPDGGCLVPCT